MWILNVPPPTNPLIEQIKPTIVIEEPVKEPTLEEKIASNYYKCDETIQYIRADNAECLAKPLRTAQYTTQSQNTSTQARSDSHGNLYAYGNCTHLAKELRPDLPNNLGNANMWYINAKAQGLPVGYEPAVGAVAEAITGYMHVAVVQKIDGDRIYIIEKNYEGFNIVSSRWANASDFRYLY